MVFIKKSEAELAVAQTEWEENKKYLDARKNEHLQTAIAELENRVHQLAMDKTAELGEIQTRIDITEQEINQLQQQLSELSVFKFSEKSNLKKQLASKRACVAEMKSRLSQKNAEYDSKIEEAQQENENFRYDMTKKLNVIYAAGESPKDRFARLKKEQAELSIGRFPFNSPDIYIRRYYPHLLSYYGKACEKELEDIFEAFFLEMTQLPSVYMGSTGISKARRYYEPFLTETVEGQVNDRFGTITKRGTIYYEYNGI